MERTHIRGVALAIAGALVFAACNASASTPTPTTAPTTEAGGAPTTAATPSPSALPGATTFGIGGPGPSVADEFIFAALDDLKGQGYKATQTTLSTPDLAVQGVAQGALQFGYSSTSTAMAAIEKGADVRVIANYVGNEWTVYADTAVPDCAGMNGKKLAVTSLTAATAAMIKNWIAKSCPGTAPNWLVIANSPDRLNALLAGQIDAAPLQAADGVVLEANPANAGKFHAVTSFASSLPLLSVNSIYVNETWAKANPATVTALLTALVTEFRKAAADPSYIKTTALKYNTGIDAKYADQVAQRYHDLKLFDPNGGLTAEGITFSATYYGPAPAGAGVTKTVLPNDQLADLTYLQAVLKNLGTQ